MADHPDLDHIYTEAKSALKAGDYDHARDLLTSILAVDENFKDASRLLAQTVRLRRRRWYNDIRLWGAMIGAIVIGLLVWVVPKMSQKATLPSPAPNKSSLATAIPENTTIPTLSSSPTQTSIQLTWKRIYMGQEFARDTVTGIAVDKNDPDVIYVGMMNAGIFESIDGGNSWKPAILGLADAHVESLLMDPQNVHTLYAGTTAGIFKTVNGGENWARIGDGYQPLMDPQNTSHLYAESSDIHVHSQEHTDVVYETTDGGVTWQSHHVMDCPRQPFGTWALNPKDGKTLLASSNPFTCQNGLYQSTDGGSTWSFLGVLGAEPSKSSVEVVLDEQGRVVIFTNIGNGFVSISKDDGKTWSFISLQCLFLSTDQGTPNIPSCSYGQDVIVFPAAGPQTYRNPLWQNGVSAFYMDTYNSVKRIIAGEQGLSISTDNGNSWTEKNSGLGTPRLELKIDPINSTRMYLAVYSGESENQCSLYRSDDSGKNWKTVATGGEKSYCGPSFDGANSMYVLLDRNLEKSEDSGDTWISPSTIATSDFIFANPYIPNFLYLETDAPDFLENGVHVFFSTDGGSSWREVTNDQFGGIGNNLYFGQGGNRVYSAWGPIYSPDSGKSWYKCNGPLVASNSDSQLAIDPRDDNHLYLASRGKGVLISKDGCESWNPSNDGIGNYFVNTTAIDPNHPDTIYAGTEGGAYISLDGGANWRQVNDGLLGETVIYSIVVDKDSNVYAATPYGIFQLEKK